MPQRLRYGKAFPEGVHALQELGRVISASGLELSLGANREGFVRQALGEVEHALDGNPRRADILEEFRSLGPKAEVRR